jgi:dUTPase
MIKGDSAQFHADRHGLKMTKHPGDCGIDLFPFGISKIERIEAKGSGLLGQKAAPWPIIYISTKVHLTICAGCYLFVTSRSSTAMLVPSATFLDGKIDAGYTGELLVRFACHRSLESETIAFIEEAIEQKKALAQAVPQQFCYPQFHLVTESNIITPGSSNIIAPFGARGNNGFGSTDLPPDDKS